MEAKVMEKTGTNGISFSYIMDKRDIEPVAYEKIKEMKEASLAKLRERLAEPCDRHLLDRLVKKSTDSQRCRALHGRDADPAAIRGFLRHIDIPEFPHRLYPFLFLENKTIKALLRAVRGQ